MRSAKRRRVNVLEIKCLRSMVGVTQIDRVKNEEVHRRVGIERELAGRVDRKVLRWFGHGERMNECRMAERVEGGGEWIPSAGQTEVKLDGWYKVCFGQQINDGGGCA